MAGAITFHQAGTIVASRFLPLVGEPSGSEAIGVLPHTTTIVAQAGDICSVYNDAECIVYRYPEGGSVPSVGYRLAANLVERLTLNAGEVVRVTTV